MGRAVVDLALAQNVAQRGDGNVTPWLEWFLDTYTEACRTSTSLIGEALVRTRFWADHYAVSLNEMQRRVLNKMLDAGPGRFDGGLTARKYAVIAGTTKVTASRHIADLLEKGLIVRTEGPSGRSTRYDLALAGWQWRPTPV